jgi:hypothetical protein
MKCQVFGCNFKAVTIIPKYSIYRCKIHDIWQTPIGSKDDHSFEEWERDHIDG